MDVIKIKNRNHSVLDIQCDWGIAQELSEFFSFYVPQVTDTCQHTKTRYGMARFVYLIFRLWICLVGLYAYIQDFAKSRDYIIEVEIDKRYGSPCTKRTD